MAEGYEIPAGEGAAEVEDRGSRFLGICAPVDTVEAARGFVDAVRARHPEASHHVFAFAVGHGATVTHGMSDDGEPSGTAGRPALAVVQGCGLGDLVVVIVRWFGGTKLGTGGLVRAYTKAAQQAIAATPTARRYEAREVEVRLPYERYDACREAVRRAAEQAPETPVEVVAEEFAEDARLRLRGPVAGVGQVLDSLRELTAGRAEVLEPPSESA